VNSAKEENGEKSKPEAGKVKNKKGE